MNSIDNNKKIFISVGVFAAVMAVIVLVLALLGGADSKPEQETTTLAGSVFSDGENEGMPPEVLTSAPVTTSPAMNNVDIMFTDAESAIMTAYTTGRYYLSGAIISGGTSTSIDLAMSGHDFYTTTEIEGMDLGVMYLNGKVYFINNKLKKYLDFDSIATLVGGNLGFDMSELDSISESMDMTQYNFTDMEKTHPLFNGEESNCYRFYNDELALYFYFVNDELKQIDFGSANGEISSSTVVNEFLTEIPSGMLSLRGLTMSTVFDFFGTDILSLQ